LGAATGVRTPILNKSAFCDLRVKLPSLPVQRRIADILSAYDDLIENNLRRIRILEEMARALYREWFVHFRFPGHESVTRIVSQLGPIPRDWEVKRLDEVTEIKGGKQLEKEEIHESGRFPVFGGNGIQGYSDRGTHQGFVIAFGRVGANCGSIHWSYEGAWLNNNSSSVVPHRHDELVLQHLLDFNFTNLRGGAAQPFISNSVLAAIQLVLPSERLAVMFCTFIRPLRLLQVVLENQTANLRRTRDLLLPRLLSGQVPLAIDTAKPIENVA
jgi:type I restriction enzyme S subunit